MAFCGIKGSTSVLEHVAVWANRAWGSGKVQLPWWLEEHLGVTWGDCREPGVPRSNSVLMLPLSLLNVPPDLGLDFVFFLCRHFLIFKEAPNSCVYLANTRLRTEQNMGVLY